MILLKVEISKDTVGYYQLIVTLACLAMIVMMLKFRRSYMPSERDSGLLLVIGLGMSVLIPYSTNASVLSLSFLIAAIARQIVVFPERILNAKRISSRRA